MAFDDFDEVLDDVDEDLGDIAGAFASVAKAAIDAKAGTAKYKEEIRQLNDLCASLRATIRNLQNELKNVKNVDAFKQMQATAQQTANQFASYIRAIGLEFDQLDDYNDNTIVQVYDNLTEGAMTYSDAISVVRQRYAQLIRESSDSSVLEGMFQQLLSTMQGVASGLDVLKEKINDIETNRVKAIAAPEIQVPSKGDAVVDYVKEFTEAAAGMTDEAKAAYDPLIKLVEALSSFSNVDDIKLSNIANTFRNLSDVGTGSFSNDKINKIADLAIRLRDIAAGGFGEFKFDISGLNGLKIDKRNVEKFGAIADKLAAITPDQFAGLIELGNNAGNIEKILTIDPSNGINNLKVSKASLNNLATYLPEIEKISAKKLQGIFGVDPTGINSLKVSKASITNVENLARAVEILKENNIDLTLKGDSTQELDKIIDRMQDVSQATETATSSVNDFEQAFFDVTNSKGLKGDVADALRTRAVPKEDIASIVNALDAVDGKIENVKVNWKNYGDEGRHVTSVILSGLNETGGAFQRIIQFTRDVNEETDEVTWTAKLAQGAENFKMAADEAAASEEKLVEIDGRLADVISAKRKAQEQYDAAVAAGVNSNELEAMNRLIGSYEVLEDTIKSGGVTQNDYSMFMSNAASKSRLLTDILKEQTNAQKDLQVETVNSKSAILELQNAQLAIQGVIDKAIKSGVTEDNDALQALIEMRDWYGLVEETVRQAGMSQEAYDAALENTDKEIQLYSKQLGFAIQLHKDEAAAAKAAAKAEAELANTVQARGAIGKATAGIDKTVSGAQAVGVSVDNADLQQLAVYRQLLAELDAELDDLNLTQKEFSTIMGNLKAIFQAPEAAVKKLTASLKEQQNHIAKSAKIYDAVKSATEEYADAQNDSNSNVRAAYTVITNLRRELDGAAASYKNGKITAAQYDEAVKSTNDELNEQVKVLKNAGYGADETASKFAQLTQQLTRFITPLYLARKAWQTVKEMANVVIELEDAFAQLQIVTGATDDELEEFYETSAKIASDLGKSITDIAASIEVFSRLGYSLPDATQLAQYATILSNVAGVSTDEATTGLTSIIKGYNMHVEKAEHVSDVLISIGQKYAVSAGEMMEAYERSGAALAATNTSFEKSAAIIAAANAAIQNSSTVGKVLPMHTVMYA